MKPGRSSSIGLGYYRYTPASAERRLRQARVRCEGLGELAESVVRRRGGRVVKLLGDGVLLVFESACTGVTAVVELAEKPAFGSSGGTATVAGRLFIIVKSVKDIEAERAETFIATLSRAWRGFSGQAPLAVPVPMDELPA